MNSEPLSMLMARTGKGIRSASRSRTAAAACGGRPPAELERVPAGHDVAGGELLPDLAREGPDVERVELDQVARPLDRPVGRLADRVGPCPASLADAHPASGARLVQLARAAQAGQDPADHRGRQDDADPAQEDPELVLAPAWVARAGPRGRRRAARSSRSAGAAGAAPRGDPRGSRGGSDRSGPSQR